MASGVSLQLLVLSTLALGVVETVLSGVWVGPYFRIGIPIFRWRPPQRSLTKVLPPVESIMADTQRGFFTPLVMRELEPSTYAFRESGWYFGARVRYTPVMRGTLELTADGHLQVVGRVNWTVLLLAVTLADFAARLGGVGGVPGIVLAVFSLIMVGSYVVQTRRYREVGERAAELLTN